MKGRRIPERRIVVRCTGTAKAGDIRLELIKAAVRDMKELAQYNEEREIEQYRDLCQDKQR